MLTEAKVATLNGLAYTRRLCRHFAHRFPATVAGNEGRIEFPFGLCTIDNDAEHMHIRINSAHADDLERAERVLKDHLIRMANKDDPVVTWERNSLAES